MNQIIIILLLCVFSAYASAQNKQANNWYFGHNAGITFNTANGSPQPLYDGQIDQSEGCASISDGAGNLLFYTDGLSVWNAQHDTMPNGKGLTGHPSSTMSAIVVPWPCRDSLYYLFTVPMRQGSPGLSYYIINMNLDGGLGDVINGSGQVLTGPTHEMVTSVKHANDTSFWVVTHIWETNTFRSFLIDKDSLHHQPVECSIGAVHSAYSITGYLKASIKGNYICCAVCPDETFQLFDFNNETAQMSNPLTFPRHVYNDAYGIEFSPDESKLYFSSYNFGGNTILMQYDIGLPDSAAIINSSVFLDSVSSTSNPYGALQIGPDSRIYTTRSGRPYLCRINFPNEAGLACRFEDSAVLLDNGSGNHLAYLGLPAFIQSFFNQANFTWEGHCIGDTSFFAITDTASQDSVFWDFGDPASGVANYSDSFFPYHIYEDTGAYQVSVIGYNNNLNDTTVQEIFIHPLPVPLLPTDTGFCEDYGVNLWPGNFQSYLWQNGTTDTSFYADTTLSVIVEVTDVQGCKATDSTHALEHSKPLPVVIYHD